MIRRIFISTSFLLILTSSAYSQSDEGNKAPVRLPSGLTCFLNYDDSSVKLSQGYQSSSTDSVKAKAGNLSAELKMSKYSKETNYEIRIFEYLRIESGTDDVKTNSYASQTSRFEKENLINDAEIEYISLLGANSGKYATVKCSLKP